MPVVQKNGDTAAPLRSGEAPCLAQRCLHQCTVLTPEFTIAAKIITKKLYTNRGNPKYRPFWGSPLFYKAPPQDNFGLQNVNWHPPKCKLTPSKKGLATSNLQFLYRNIQNLPSTICIWRASICILEAEIVLAGLSREGGTPKKGGTLASPQQTKCFGAINFVKLQKNHFTKQILWPVSLQKGTRQWH